MRLWTYRWHPVIDGRRHDVRLESHSSQSVATVAPPGEGPVRDVLRFREEPYRIQQLWVPANGGELLFEIAPRTWYSFGLRVSRDGRVLYQSHDDPFAYFPKLKAMLDKAQAGRHAGGVDTDRLRRNAPAIVTDLALGLLFFVAAKLTDLRSAALVAAGAGIALYGVQWVLNRVFDRLRRPHIDLLGGLAVFGVVMLLISAGLSWRFDSELAVQLKATYLGLIGAAFFALDAWRGAPYLGKRLTRYLAYNDVDPQRLAWGFAAVGAVMAGVNAVLALTASRDVWLYYSVWGDMLLAIALSVWAIERARRPAARVA